jgi:antirestriction protein ArdC
MDTYAIVTEKIINLLEQEIVPWRRPWSATGQPCNLITRKPYRGINYFLLSASKFVSPFWLTLKQANQLGGSVRKGEQSTMIVFWKVDEAQNDDGLNQDESAPQSKRRFLLRYYRAFNAEQCDLPQRVLDKLPKVETYQHDPIEAAERIIAGMPNPPEIVRAGSQAFYSPITDRVTLPPRELFTSPEEEACTIFHECSHASGAPKRLNRSSIAEAAPFGSPTYSFEELVAEMSAAFLCAEAGISPAVISNQAAYIQGWLAKIRSDKRLVIMAAAQGQKAADVILNRTAHSL